MKSKDPKIPPVGAVIFSTATVPVNSSSERKLRREQATKKGTDQKKC
jgi:hypothetical protein